MLTKFVQRSENRFTCPSGGALRRQFMIRTKTNPRSRVACAAMLAGTLITFAHATLAQQTGTATPDGGTFIEIKDGLPRSCININNSLVSAYVLAVKAVQNSSWLPSWIVSTKNLGVRVNTTFLNAAAQSSAFNFPNRLLKKTVADLAHRDSLEGERGWRCAAMTRFAADFSAT